MYISTKFESKRERENKREIEREGERDTVEIIIQDIFIEFFLANRQSIFSLPFSSNFYISNEPSMYNSVIFTRK